MDRDGLRKESSVGRVMVTEHAVDRIRDIFQEYVDDRRSTGNKNGSADATGCLKLTDEEIREVCKVETVEEVHKGLPSDSYDQLDGGDLDYTVPIYPDQYNKFPIPIILVGVNDKERDAYDVAIVTAMTEQRFSYRRDLRRMSEGKERTLEANAQAVNKVAASVFGKVVDKLHQDMCDKGFLVVLVNKEGRFDRAVGLESKEETEKLLGEVWGEYSQECIRIYSLNQVKVQITF